MTQEREATSFTLGLVAFKTFQKWSRQVLKKFWFNLVESFGALCGELWVSVEKEVRRMRYRGMYNEPVNGYFKEVYPKNFDSLHSLLRIHFHSTSTCFVLRAPCTSRTIK